MAKTVEWAKIASKLPWGKDVESDKRRKLLFRQFDPNGNGLLSLAEADKGLIELQLNIPKPVIMRAFQASKGVNQETKASNDDYVDYTEFRVFLLYIRQYMELWVMFEAIDSSKDHKITPDEFVAAAPAISKWGLQIADAATTFREIDHDKGGVILFDEFAHWAIKQRLKIEGSDNVERAGLGSGLISDSLKPAAGVKGSQRKGPAAAATPQKQNIDWGRIAQKLPWGTDEKSTADRKLLFRTFDPNGNGLLSLAEADKGIIELGLGDVICKAVIMRAYQSAKGLNQSGDKRQNDDYIDSGEFRMFLLYVRQYLELWVMFDAIDADKNKKIEAKEFAAAAALVEKWGFKVEDPAATFKEIDADKGGCILFDEFAHWAIKKKLDLEDDDDAPDAGAGSGLIAKSQSTAAGAAAHAGGAKKPEQKAPTTMKVDWKKVAEKLPWGTDEASALTRKRLFRQFDPNGNGLLSLAEADKGVVVDLQLGDVCSKQVIMRAFNAAKSVNQSGNKAQNDDYVDFSEFRMFLLYLRQYLELWVMFEAIDTNKDKRIERAEFAAAVNLVSKWGFKIDNPDAIFAEIDQDGGGMILFDEFAHWAIQKKLDLEDDDDAPDAGAGSGLISGSPKPKAGVTAVKKSPTAVAPPATKAIDWADVAKKLPWGTDEESVKRRKKLFKVFDPNGNGLLSLAEVDKGVGEDLKMGDVICKAVIMRAFQASKAVNKSDSKAANDDYVDFTEFRTLLLYLRQYLELWVMFEAIDTNKDKRIDASEFAAAAKLVEKWGTTIKDPAEVFAEIDVDGGGMILFDEFADWAIRKQLDLPDDDDAENAGQGTGVSRTGADIKVRGVTARKPAASPAARASPAKTPARPPVSKSPSPRPAPKPAAPAPAARTPPPPARNKSPAPRAADKPAWGSTKSSEMKKAPPAPSKFGSPPKTEQKVSLGIKFEANADGAVGVTVVNPDSTASRAGLLVGDILASLDGKVISSKEEFKAILPSLQPGSTVDLLVKRGGEDVALKLAF